MNTDFADFLRKEREEREEKADKCRDLLMRALKSAGVKKVAVDFNGYGDSGNVENIAYTPKSVDGKTEVSDSPHEVREWSDSGSKLVVRNYTLDELVEQLCYDLLYANHPGWEINEGSFGEFEINVTKNSVGLVFNERVETYETSEEEY